VRSRPRARYTAVILAASLLWLALAAGEAGKAPAATDVCTRGKALTRLGRYDQAAAAYLKGLEIAASLRCSRRGLARLNRTGDLCATPDALESVGRRDAAQAAYLKLLKEVPHSPCANEGVAATDPNTRFWNWLGSAIKDVGNLLIAIAVGTLLVALAVTAMFGIASRWRGVRDLRLVRWLRRPVVQIDELNDSALTERLGGGTTAFLRAGFAKGSGLALHRIDLLSSEAAPVDALGGLSTVSTQAAAAAAFLTLVRAATPRVVWRVRGELQAAGELGYGLTIAFQAGRRYSRFTDFWSSQDAGPMQSQAPSCKQHPSMAETFRRLTIPTAGWLEHQLAAVRHPERLLTKDAMSWALLTTGLHWQEQAERSVAKNFYRRALQFDPENVGALANLGTALGEEEGHFQEAEQRLCDALSLVEQSAGRHPLRYNANWYRVKYSLALIYANRAAGLAPTAAESSGIAEKARRHAKELLQTTVAARPELACRFWRHPITTVKRWWKVSRAERKELETFLRDTTEPSALILYAARLQRSGRAPARASYREVRRELKLETPNPEIFVAYLSALDRRTPRVDYNLACLYVAWDRFDEAANSLRASVNRTPPLQQPRRIARALEDPTLAPLWDKEPGKTLQTWLKKLHSEQTPAAAIPHEPEQGAPAAK
jgi:tetratricopeptide (TPR) repeat protein